MVLAMRIVDWEWAKGVVVGYELWWRRLVWIHGDGVEAGDGHVHVHVHVDRAWGGHGVEGIIIISLVGGRLRRRRGDGGSRGHSDQLID